MKDKFARNIDYLRISITDRCNLRCKYCMPKDIDKISMDNILSYEEIVYLVRIFAELGLSKIKITGGEPLVRKDVDYLISNIKSINGIKNISLTTNGILLDKYLDIFKMIGLDSINISLDTIDHGLYEKITGYNYLDKVLDNIKKALNTNIKIKLNVVSLDYSSLDDIDIFDNVLNLIKLAKDNPLDIRFIEVMPIGYGKTFKIINNHDLLNEIIKRYPNIHKDNNIHGNGPANYYHIDGFKGSIGFISAINDKFCDKCNRIRLTSDGYLKTCLCFNEGVDLKSLLRNNVSDDDIKEIIYNTIYHKPQEHHFEDISKISEDKNMSDIGG